MSCICVIQEYILNIKFTNMWKAFFGGSGTVFFSDCQTPSCWLAVEFFSDLLLMQLAFSMENLTEREREREGELCELKIDSGRVVVMIASPHYNLSVRLALLLHFASTEHWAGIHPLYCLLYSTQSCLVNPSVSACGCCIAVQKNEACFTQTV